MSAAWNDSKQNFKILCEHNYANILAPSKKFDSIVHARREGLKKIKEKRKKIDDSSNKKEDDSVKWWAEKYYKARFAENLKNDETKNYKQLLYQQYFIQINIRKKRQKPATFMKIFYELLANLPVSKFSPISKSFFGDLRISDVIKTLFSK